MHLNFAQEGQALLFLHRSKLSPIGINLINTAPSLPLIGLLCLHSAWVGMLRADHLARLDSLLGQALAQHAQKDFEAEKCVESGLKSTNSVTIFCLGKCN